MRDRLLLVWGAGLLALSLALSVVSATVLPDLLQDDAFGQVLADGTLVTYAVAGWLQQATLALGAALVAAHVLLRQLVPRARPAEPEVDWYG